MEGGSGGLKVLVSGILINCFFVEQSLMEPFRTAKNTWKYVERLAGDI